MNSTITQHKEHLSSLQRVCEWLNGLAGEELYGMHRIVRVVHFQILSREMVEPQWVYDVVALVEIKPL